MLLENSFRVIFCMSLSVCSLLPVYAANDTISAAKVVSVVSADWNGDGDFDRAVLVEADESDMTDLLIFLSTASGTMRLVEYKSNIAWRGAMWGTQPSLGTNEQGSLVVSAANEAIGRNRWHQKLTLIYRRDRFIVAGYSYSDYDTLKPDTGMLCDINFLAGRGVSNGVTVKLARTPRPLKDWTQTMAQQWCR